MSRGFPSMTALLSLLAVAAYQHRDKIAEMLGSIGQSTSGGAGPNGIGGLLGQLSRGLGGASAGGLLSGGIGELLDSIPPTSFSIPCRGTATPGRRRRS